MSDNQLKLNKLIIAEKILQNKADDALKLISTLKNIGLVKDMDDTVEGRFLQGDYQEAVKMADIRINNEMEH